MRKSRRFSVSLSAITVLSVTAAAIAAVSVCIAVFASVYSRALMRDAYLSSEQAVDQTQMSINHYFDSMKQKLALIHGAIGKMESAAEFEDKISTLTSIQEDIYAVTVYGENGEIIGCTGSGEVRKSAVYRDLSFDKKLFESAEGFAISTPHVQTLFEGEYPWVVTVAVKAEPPVLGTGAYIAVDFNFSEIAKNIDRVSVGRRGYCFIIDKDGGMVYHPQQQLLFSGLKEENAELLSTFPEGSSYEKNVIYTLKSTEDQRWRIVGVSFTDELAAERRTQVIISILIAFFSCAMIALLVLAIYSRIVNRPVQSLIRAMKRFENDADHFRFSGGTETVTDLRVLSVSFEHMSSRIQKLMERVRKEETELRKTELKALQAQINPHFLYNTLDSIQWMCEQGKTEDASKMVSALARLFRISISRGHELITIKDEMRHAQNYLIIQSFRYRDQFVYSFDIDPALEQYLCNKITVQPLIENAIYHGIDRLVDEGEIKISVQQAPDDEKDILITVADNGVGMTEEQCRRILQKERSDSSGIGVKNVNDRLKIYFGDKYGLTIRSELDVGTTVIARIPKITAEQEKSG